MQAEPPHQQGPGVEPTVNQSVSYARWQQIGHHALRLVRPSEARALREILAECEALIVYEHWLAHDQNLTNASELLGISRLRARRALKRWEAASGEEHDPCRP